MSANSFASATCNNGRDSKRRIQYPSTERVTQREQIGREKSTIRVIANIQQPVCVQALALLRDGIFHNLISQTLVRQLNMVPSSTTETEQDPFTGDDLKIYGSHTVAMTVADNAGQAKTFEVPFSATDMKEDLVLGLEWFEFADPDVVFWRRIFYWRS